MAEAVTRVPPPLPPKTRRGSSTSVNSNTGNDAVLAVGATVYVPASPPASSLRPETNTARNIPIVQSSNPSAGDGQSKIDSHVVTIRISPQDRSEISDTSDQKIRQPEQEKQFEGSIRISVGGDTDMVQKRQTMTSMTEIKQNLSPNYFYYSYPSGIAMSSGQCSPSDTLDSGTCSDLDGTPPPLPKKKNLKSVSVTVINRHERNGSVASSLTSSGPEGDSDDNENDRYLSCDSLNSSDLSAGSMESPIHTVHQAHAPSPPCPPRPPSPSSLTMTFGKSSPIGGLLPQGLLKDIRDHSGKLTVVTKTNKEVVEQISVSKSEPETKSSITMPEPDKVQLHAVDIKPATTRAANNSFYDADKFYKFHLNEHIIEEGEVVPVTEEDDNFAGYKDLREQSVPCTIRSAKGTVRGVKNRVRAGIATFLQIHNTTTKSYKEKDAGKVVLYTTTMGIVRETYQQCMMVKQILRTLLVKFEERDVFMGGEFQEEIKDRMNSDQILVPQLFVDGQLIGDAEAVEKLNETGELRRMLKAYKSADACNTCQVCGGYRLLPCPVCSGSKKSVHRNHFTAEFVALKCMNCDEVGLVRCHAC